MPASTGLALCGAARAAGTRNSRRHRLGARPTRGPRSCAFAAGADDSSPSRPPRGRVALARRGAARSREPRRAPGRQHRELSFLADLGACCSSALDRAGGAPRRGRDLRGDLRLALRGRARERARRRGRISARARAARQRQGVAACVFDREGSAEGPRLVAVRTPSRWLDSSPSAPELIEAGEKFLLPEGGAHSSEYAAPLRFGGPDGGALVVAFDRREACGETESRLIDAAAQQARSPRTSRRSTRRRASRRRAWRASRAADGRGRRAAPVHRGHHRLAARLLLYVCRQQPARRRVEPQPRAGRRASRARGDGSATSSRC